MSAPPVAPVTPYAPRTYGGGGGYAATDYLASLPGWYKDWFTRTFGTLEDYYTDMRGGLKQAYQDYNDWTGMWQGATFTPLTDSSGGNLFQQFSVYANNLKAQGRTPAMADLFQYTQGLLAKPQAPTGVSYLKTGNIA